MGLLGVTWARPPHPVGTPKSGPTPWVDLVALGQAQPVSLIHLCHSGWEKHFFSSKRCHSDCVVFNPSRFKEGEVQTPKHTLVTNLPSLEPSNAAPSPSLARHVFKITASQRGESFCLCSFTLGFRLFAFRLVVKDFLKFPLAGFPFIFPTAVSTRC